MMKRGQGSGLTWFVAFVIIFFMMLVFAALSSSIAVKKFSKGSNEIKLQSEKNLGNMESQRFLLTFLNHPIEFNKKNITIYDLVKENEISNENAGEIFSETAQNFFDVNFPKEKWTDRTCPWWVRVYGENETMIKSTNRKFHAGGYDCNPEKNILSIVYIGNKKVVLCVMNIYYSWKEN